MPKKYHIHVKPTPPRFTPIGKFGVMDWAEGCLKCTKCAKTTCIYGVYKVRSFDIHQLVDSIDYYCKNCFRCVQSCPEGLIIKTINPEYLEMGDAYWTPDIISSTWYQAETGKIPISGAGYRGPFVGEGFDDMWTDMSEIVRPTRDGIHGREYISTSIDLGRKLSYLSFNAKGRLTSGTPSLLEIPIPIIFGKPPVRHLSGKVYLSMVKAAHSLGTFLIAPPEIYSQYKNLLRPYVQNIIPVLSKKTLNENLDLIPEARIIELSYPDEIAKTFIKKGVEKIKDINPKAIVSVSLPLTPKVKEIVTQLTTDGIDIIHVYADQYGREWKSSSPRFIKDVIMEIHLNLVEKHIRDQVTLLASGGIAMAEHVAKVITCGADGVVIDLPLLVALECRLCRACFQDGPLGLCEQPCPVEIQDIEPDWGAQRMINLMGAWHGQLLEVLGAMGLREIRRLRGETGRVMFYRDLERETFGRIFSDKKGQRSVLTPTSLQATERHQEVQASVDRMEKAFPERWPPEIRETPTRFKRAIGKYLIRRSPLCNNCGICVDLCPYGVHKKVGNKMLVPRDYRCIGFTCQETDHYCVDKCPERALTLVRNPMLDTLGDKRWTADLLISTWYQAETGKVPMGDLEYKTGDSGGGFDKLRFKFESQENPKLTPSEDKISTSISLNRRNDDRPKITISVPFYGGGMSFGSVSLTTMLARAKAAMAWNTFTCTGEGGYPEALVPYADYIITQVATGLFGVREETIQRARIVEFKYAQGAKPGLGGHLLGDKVTHPVAKMRGAVAGSALFSPFPFHSVYSVEDHKKHVDWIKQINPHALISVKVSTPTDVDMVAVGSYYAGAHIIHLDGSYGGTGAAPDIAKKNVAMPIEYAIPKVHQTLIDEGIRDEMVIIASGGIRTAYDIAKAIALGADGAVTGTSELVALECSRCGHCESGRGCPRGIATTDPQLAGLMKLEWASQRIINLFASWHSQLVDILRQLGMRSITELVGRTDCLVHLDYIKR